MAIENTDSTVTQVGNGSTTAFPVTYPFGDAADLQVWERVLATGAETLKTLGVDYTVAGGGGSTGTVTAVSAPPATVSWTIRRRTPRTQGVVYPEGDPFPAATHEGVADKLTRIVQEQEGDFSRALLLPVTASVGSVSVPEPSPLRLIGWDATGTDLANYVPNSGDYLPAELVNASPELANLTTAEIQQLQNIDGTTINAAQWGYLGAAGVTGGALMAASSAVAALTVLGVAPTECRLVRTGATTLTLQRHAGRYLLMNGAIEEIPAAGVTVSPPAANQFYYIYAFMNGGMMTLEASTTASVQDAVTGIEVKSVDATKTLVGWALTNSSGEFVDDSAERLVRSRYNQPPLALQSSGFSAPGVTGDVALWGTGPTVQWIDTPDTVATLTGGYYGILTAGAGHPRTRIYVDGAGAQVPNADTASTTEFGNPISTRALQGTSIGRRIGKIGIGVQGGGTMSASNGFLTGVVV